MRHNGTSVDTTPGPREGKVEGRGRQLREGAISGSAPFRRRPSKGKYTLHNGLLNTIIP